MAKGLKSASFMIFHLPMTLFELVLPILVRDTAGVEARPGLQSS